MKNLGSQHPVSRIVHVDTRIRPSSGVLQISSALKEIQQKQIRKNNQENFLSATMPNIHDRMTNKSKVESSISSQYNSRPSSQHYGKFSSRPQSTIPSLNFTIHQLISRPGSGISLRELSVGQKQRKKPNSSQSRATRDLNVPKSAKMNTYMGSYSRPMSKMKENRINKAVEAEREFLKRRIQELNEELQGLADTLYIQNITPEQLLAITTQYCQRFREFHDQQNNYTQWVQNLLNSNYESQTQLQKSYDQVSSTYQTHNDQINNLILEISFLQTQLNQFTQYNNVQYLKQLLQQIQQRENTLETLKSQIKGIDEYKKQLQQTLGEIKDLHHKKEQIMEAGNVQKAKFESQLSLLRSMCETQENDFEDMKRNEITKKEQNYQKQSIQSRKDFIQQYAELERKCNIFQNKIEWQKSKISQLNSKLEELQLTFQIETAEGQRMRLLMLSNYVKKGIKASECVIESLFRKISVIDNAIDDVTDTCLKLENNQLTFIHQLSELGQSGTYSDNPLHLDDFFH